MDGSILKVPSSLMLLSDRLGTVGIETKLCSRSSLQDGALVAGM